ncbi:polysaccharide deacetylase family protein [Geoalkalibacter halelectricus]|uniref:Polysaccharide deacetylase family protein n=1 Tax=Geoalkalibacter halelectricus TaxID=2847045 RepID=A0ABY5ZL09_9BACT|nr:polysaccharide deacetylase family protein [Geoalkalibacter halelectricus]MDO3379734.1 polysaccharide deacetylase family protein [Geoalkalibacter halelectricus]UWZ79268.1 polysaccharide deacetylase family protein [Geoalkalibacter halelectricus]
MPSQLDILTFHRIMPRGEKYFIPPMAMDVRTFTRLIERLVAADRVVDLQEGVKLLRSGELMGRKVAITFDDGYLDNFVWARDVLLRVGAPATFFVPLTPIDNQDVYWWDHLYDMVSRDDQSFFKWALSRNNPQALNKALENAALSRSRSHGERCRVLVQAANRLGEQDRKSFLGALVDEFGPCRAERLLMNWDELRQMQTEGFSIGSHSVSHIPLTDLEPQAARYEITASADLLKDRLGCRPAGFCYPRGAFRESHAEMVKDCGYDFAVTTCFGGNDGACDPFVLKRRNMSDYQGVRAWFPVAMHLFELSGRLDGLLAARRSA